MGDSGISSSRSVSSCTRWEEGSAVNPTLPTGAGMLLPCGTTPPPPPQPAIFPRSAWGLELGRGDLATLYLTGLANDHPGGHQHSICPDFAGPSSCRGDHEPEGPTPALRGGGSCRYGSCWKAQNRWWVNVWASALPRTPSPPGPPHLDMHLVLELHGLEVVAGDDPFLRGKERRVGIAWQGGSPLLEDTAELVLALP